MDSGKAEPSRILNFSKAVRTQPPAEPTNLVEAGNRLLFVISSAQRILADYVHPEGITKDQALNDLLDLLDGPPWRKARDVWNVSVTEATKTRKR
jgi:hypothetical protein